jgi:hypothetical protein
MLAKPPKAESKRSEVPIFRNAPRLNEHFGGEHNEANGPLWTDTNEYFSDKYKQAEAVMLCLAFSYKDNIMELQ